MENEFKTKVLRPGDKGFEYDKRIDFSSNIKSAAEEEENSWDEDADEDNENDDYFDDDFA